MTKYDDLVERLANVRCEGIEEMCWEAADAIEELESAIEWQIGRAETAETKLAKAVEALGEAWFMLTVPNVDYEPEPEEPGLRRIKTILAELKGEK
jgi:hypothetical protein